MNEIAETPATGVICYRKAADIPEEAILAAIRTVIRIRREQDGFKWFNANRWDIAAVLAGRPEDVGQAPVDYPLVPWKVLNAKLRRMGRRGLVDGCWCGCRGDWEVIADRDAR